MEEWHTSAEKTPEGSRWYMLIPQDCTAQSDQIIKEFFLLHAYNVNNIDLLAKHTKNIVSTNQWRSDTQVL